MKAIRLFALAMGIALICSAIPWQSQASREKSPSEEDLKTADQSSTASWLRLTSPTALNSSLSTSANSGMQLKSLAAGDFDSDGVPDLVSGFSSASGGQIAVQRGNIDALYPNSPEAQIRGTNDVTGQPPFLTAVKKWSLPNASDFVGAGDFDADGYWDVVTAARGDNVLLFLKGNGRGDLSKPKPISLAGNVTTLATGDVNRRDGLTDIIVGVQRNNSSSLLIFENATGALKGGPETIALPAEAMSIAVGQLDESYETDLVVAVSNEVIFIQGRDRGTSLDDERRSLVSDVQVTHCAFETGVTSVAVGDFVGDARDEIAVLTVDGSVQVFKRDLLSSMKAEATNLTAATDQFPGWDNVETARVNLPAPATSVQNLSSRKLVAAKISSLPKDDLVITNSDNDQLQVITSEPASAQTDSAITLTDRRMLVNSVNLTSSTTAVLPMRLTTSALQSLVVGTESESTIVLSPSVGATMTVNTNVVTDTRDAVLSLSEAVKVANGTLAFATLTAGEKAQVSGTPANPGLDAINFNIPGAGVPTITDNFVIPQITDAVILDGTTQPAGKVSLQGASGQQSVLRINAGNSTVRGMVLNGSCRGLQLASNGNNLVQGNIIGASINGLTASGNSCNQIQIDSSTNNTIGGTTAAARNILSGAIQPNNQQGIHILGPNATGNLIQGNYIGTDISGNAVIGNRDDGISVNCATCTNNTIGGTTAGAGNVISGNGRDNIGGESQVRIQAVGTLVQGNLIGLNKDGTAGLTNQCSGINVTAANTTIGGTTPTARNVISGNGAGGTASHGIVLATTATNTLIQGNYIGTNATGTAAIRNLGHGVLMAGASNNTVGGAVPGAGNLISGNILTGVSLKFVSGLNPLNNSQVQGNFIGTDVTGTVAVGNEMNGLDIEPVVFLSVIGGTTLAARNVISGNRNHGIFISGNAKANPNRIEGNYIGANAFGTGPLPNGKHGIFMAPTIEGQIVGGTTPGSGNVIAFNTGDGIASDAGRQVGVSALGNSIYGNSGLGIDRGDNGPTANLTTAVDNTPILTSVNTTGGTTTINGSLQQAQTNSQTYVVQFFSNVSCDPSGSGEGQIFIGQTNVTVTNNQPVNFTANISPAVPGGRYITAIAVGPTADATKPILTSEFSFCRQNSGNAPPNQTTLRLFTLTPDRGGDIGSVTTLITGEGILPGATVLLRKSGNPDIVGTSINVAPTGTSVSAVVDLTGKPQGVWDVVVTNPNTNTATLRAAFTIEAGRAANVWSDIVGRTKVAVFPPHDERYLVLYGNSGNVDANGTVVRFDVPKELDVQFVEKVNGADPLIGFQDDGNGNFDLGKYIEFYIPKIPANSSGSLLVLLRPVQTSSAAVTISSSGYTSPSLDVPASAVIDGTLVVTPEMLEQTPNSFRMNLNFTSATRNGSVEISGIVTDGPGPETPTIEKIIEGDNITINITSTVPASMVSQPVQSGNAPLQPEGEKTVFQKIKGHKDNFDSLNTAKETIQVVMKTLKDRDLNKCLKLISNCNGSPLFSQSAIDRLERAADGTAAAKIGEMAGELYNGPGSQLVDALTNVTSGIMDSSWSRQFIDEACTSNASTTACNPFRSACDQYAASGGLADVRKVIKESIILRVVDKCSKYQKHVKEHKVIPVTSIDPNDKAGSAGLSDQHYVSGVEPLRYEIMFENLPSATAAAKQVVITDQLDRTKLDIQTFELGTATFGTHVLTPSPGLKAWSTDLDLRPGRNVIVRLNAELDINTGIATWRFTALDPATGQISTAPDGGFLPPNQIQPEGSGAVFFTVKPKPGLAEGTQINNQARIVFDANAPIDTPVWLNTIDNSKPTSQMTALPTTQSSTNFVINWSGTDAGSGIGTYTIYLSENGGPFDIWQDNVTGTSAMVAGLPNTTYAFFSIASDRAGNTELTKSAAEATTLTPSATDSVQFSSATYSANENAQVVNVTVTRLGSTTNPATVNLATNDTASQNCSTVNGSASSRCDYETNLQTIQFAAGETSKTVPILLIDDAYFEGTETFTATLSSASGVSLGSPTTTTISITDNDIVNGPNPLGDATFFVTQHYLDFLNRLPDAGGLAFWINEINSCGSSQSCLEVKRINVSAAFFLSIEFQQTGYFIERLYKTSYGDATGTSTFGGTHQLSVPIVRFNEFIPDTLQIGEGLVVGQQGWEALLESKKAAFVLQFIQRPRFTTAFPTSLTPAQFVDALFTNAGVTPTTAGRQAAINEFGGTPTSADNNARARAVRLVAENGTLLQQELNRAFVLIQYFGYLRRNPNDAPDSDYTGFDFWLTKLNQFNGNFVSAEMVKAFLFSSEFRQRFGTP